MNELSRTLVTGDGKVITLNLEQNIAVDKELEWWKSEDRYFTLSGFAGTGKTTVSKWFLTAIGENIDNWHKPVVCVAAPTHRAKKIIEKATGIPGHTVHRLLGLGLDMSLDNFDPEDPQFKPKKTPIINDYDLIILDEASMMNKKLFTYIDEQIRGRTKILIMGDPAQLPPVKEKLSVIFTSPLIRHKAALTHVERTADDNPALLIYDSIRNNLYSENDVFKHQTVINDRGEGVTFAQHTDFGKAMIEKFLSPDYKEDANYAKIVTWTNDQAGWWNRGIRKKRMEDLHQGVPHLPVMVGDIMLAYSGYEGKLENGNDYRVTRVEETLFGFKIPSKNGMQAVSIPTFAAYMENVDTGRKLFVHVLDQRKQSSIDLYIKSYWAYVNQAKKSGWKPFFEFRSWLMLMEPIEAGGKFPISKDLDYGYAMTCHKLQGSEFTNIFVDGVNINQNPTTRERNSMKYVALSRMTKMAYYRES